MSKRIKINNMSKINEFEGGFASKEEFLDYLCHEKGFLLHGSIHKINGNKIISSNGKIFGSNRASIAMMRSLYSNKGVNIRYPYFINKDNPLRFEVHTDGGEYIKKNKGFIYVLSPDGFKNNPKGSWQFIKESNETKFVDVIKIEKEDFKYPVEIFNDFNDAKYKREIKENLENFYGIKCPEFFLDICNSRKDFEQKISKESTPNWLVGFAREGKIFIMSPQAMEKESTHTKEEFDKVLTHEICHIFHYKINKNILKWIDEGVALFVSGQHKKPNFSKEDLENLFDKNFDPEKGYRASYWAIKTIFDIYGKAVLLDLIKINIKSDVRKNELKRVLGMEKVEFINKIMEASKLKAST